MAEFWIMQATVKFKHTYTCSKCGHKAAGDQRTEVCEAALPDSVFHWLGHIPRTAHYMPVGWSNSFDHGYRCKECKDA